MRFGGIAYALAGIALSGALARAQNGQIDQRSPHLFNVQTGVQFNVDATVWTWQQQIRPGISGTLEGFAITIGGGDIGAQFTLRVRAGAAPGGPVLFETNVVRMSRVLWEDQFISVMSSGIAVSAGEPFVLEVQGQRQGTSILGSRVDPADGPPLYPEPLYLNGSPYREEGYRLGFDSYVAAARCAADFNADTRVDFFDYLAFAEAFGRSDASADFNHDAQTDFFDYLDFITAFDTCQ